MCHRIAVFTFLVLVHALAIGATGAAPAAGDDGTTLETVTKTLDEIAQLRANVEGLHLRNTRAVPAA